MSATISLGSIVALAVFVRAAFEVRPGLRLKYTYTLYTSCLVSAGSSTLVSSTPSPVLPLYSRLQLNIVQAVMASSPYCAVLPISYFSLEISPDIAPISRYVSFNETRSSIFKWTIFTSAQRIRKLSNRSLALAISIRLRSHSTTGRLAKVFWRRHCESGHTLMTSAALGRDHNSVVVGKYAASRLLLGMPVVLRVWQPWPQIVQWPLWRTKYTHRAPCMNTYTVVLFTLSYMDYCFRNINIYEVTLIF